MDALIALALEAIPEELSFRGYMLATLHRRFRVWSASVIQIGLFASIMVVVSTTQSALSMVLADGEVTFAIAPAGMNPIDYLILMVFFGSVLTYVRWATGSILTTMSLHLAFLTVNRLVLQSGSRPTGWDITPTPAAALLVSVST